jgi:uncharacterized membrane protein
MAEAEATGHLRLLAQVLEAAVEQAELVQSQRVEAQGLLVVRHFSQQPQARKIDWAGEVQAAEVPLTLDTRLNLVEAAVAVEAQMVLLVNKAVLLYSGQAEAGEVAVLPQ